MVMRAAADHKLQMTHFRPEGQITIYGIIKPIYGIMQSKGQLLISVRFLKVSCRRTTVSVANQQVRILIILSRN